MNLFENNGAEFSPCGRHRYCLWRIWDATKPSVMFIGLNPSKAGADNDDRTITTVRAFALNWGYGGVYMLNLFPYISTDPDKLEVHKDTLATNDTWIKKIEAKTDMVICAWGNFKVAQERAKAVKAMITTPRALQINKNGSPHHPLYLKGTIKPILF